jgi:hypothetical protein
VRRQPQVHRARVAAVEAEVDYEGRAEVGHAGA